MRTRRVTSLFFFLVLALSGGTVFASDAGVRDLPPPVAHQLAKLIASDGTATSQFGMSVAISSDGNTIAVAASGANYTTVNNAVYVFVKPATGWADAVETAELTPSDGPGTPFATSVAISGNTIFVGSRVATQVTLSSFTFGAVYAYTEPAGGWVSTTETAKMTVSPNCNCRIGDYVAAGGNSVVTSSISESSGAPAGLYVWNKPAAGWSKQAPAALLAASDANDFWSSLAMSTTGNTIAAGSGSIVYLYAKPSKGWSGKGVLQTAQLITSDGDPNDDLGSSVALTDSTVAAGAQGRNNQQGAIYVYAKPSTGWVNAQENAQLSSPVGPLLGWSVGISGNTIVAGSPLANIGGVFSAGAAFVYNKPKSSGWTSTTQPNAELSAADAAESDELGSSVAIAGTTIVSGAPMKASGSNTRQGAAYVFGQ
jgi:hypothetical protein